MIQRIRQLFCMHRYQAPTWTDDGLCWQCYRCLKIFYRKNHGQHAQQ